jgi:teichuronic acid biosynthesis glycosyltransferase TuaC
MRPSGKKSEVRTEKLITPPSPIRSSPLSHIPKMKILFIFRSASNENVPSPFIASQIHALQQQGLEVGSFPISGKGIMAYFSAAAKLRDFLRTHPNDLIHAHYALCGLTALLAFTGKSVVLSMMGSDILGEYYAPDRITFRSRMVIFIGRVVQYFVKAIIAKSKNIYDRINRKSITRIIPNGIDTVLFQPISKPKALELLGLSNEKKYVLSLSNPAHFWKNMGLATKALQLLNHPDLVLLSPYPLAHEKIPLYLSAADVFISTSFMEGSSNVIKEAMACNCPIVATDVGDASHVMGATKGCYLTGFQPEDVAEKIGLACDFAKTHNRTNGRERIMQLGLDSETVALKIIDVYKSVLAK